VLATLLAFVQVAPKYSAVEIPILPETDHLGSVFLFEKGLVAGYWYKDIPPGHVGAMLAYPFVWQGGKMTSLPLGDAKHGHVRGGTSKMLVGDVEGEKAWIPAVWTPDPKVGWEKPTLKVLGKEEGRAVFVRDGSIYINSPTRIRRYTDGAIEDFDFKNYSVVGVDDRGRWFCNKAVTVSFSAWGNAYRALMWDKDWKPLQHEGFSMSEIVAINRKGVAIGKVFKDEYQAAIWDEKGFRILPGGKSRASANAINGKDEVVGSYMGSARVRACLWDKDGLHDLTSLVDGVSISSAEGINDEGQILAILNQRLFLLTPVKTYTSSN
jgi:uncharacterized membrane protein